MGTITNIVEGSFSGSETVQSNGKTKKEYKISYDVIADSLEEDWEHILNATPGLPPLKSAWKNGDCKCKKREPRNAVTIRYGGKLTLKWEIVCTFDDSPVPGENEEEKDPTKWPTTLTIAAQDVEEILKKDRQTGETIANPHKEPILLTVPNSYPVIEFSRYEYYPDTVSGMQALIQKFNRFKNTVNALSFMGFPPGTCFMYAPTATRENINDGIYFKVNYRILIRHSEVEEEPLKAHVLCEGYLYTKTSDESDPKRVYDTAKDDGVNKKVRLDENGNILANTAQDVFLTFNQYLESDFNELGLVRD